MKVPQKILGALLVVAIGSLGAAYLTHSWPKPTALCTQALGNKTLSLPCAWVEGVDTDAVSFGKRLRLRAFTEDGKLDDDTRGEDIKIWYESRQDLKLWPALFASFSLGIAELEKLQALPAVIKADGRFGSSSPSPFTLTVDRSGEEWIVKTFRRQQLPRIAEQELAGCDRCHLVGEVCAE